MKLTGWSWQDLMATPVDVVDAALKLLSKREDG
jgi:hypothetical protein